MMGLKNLLNTYQYLPALWPQIQTSFTFTNYSHCSGDFMAYTLYKVFKCFSDLPVPLTISMYTVT